MKTRFIDPELVRELLHYDPDTGVFTWRQRDRGRFNSEGSWKSWNVKHAGKRAGSVATGANGYQDRRIDLLREKHLEHRLAWVYMTGQQPPDQVDHRNRIATQNFWGNLRDGTGVNHKNVSILRNNTSGVTGVCWNRRIGAWAAKVRVAGKAHHLGYFHEIDEAAMEVLEFRAEHGFDPQHGLAPAHYAKSEARHV